jgi:hypothetical protein
MTEYLDNKCFIDILKFHCFNNRRRDSDLLLLLIYYKNVLYRNYMPSKHRFEDEWYYHVWYEASNSNGVSTVVAFKESNLTISLWT